MMLNVVVIIITLTIRVFSSWQCTKEGTSLKHYESITGQNREPVILTVKPTDNS